MTTVQTLTILLSSVLTGLSESCTCLLINKADVYFSKIFWITKRYFKINKCRNLLYLFNIRSTIKLKFVYLLCFTQLDVKTTRPCSTTSQCLLCSCMKLYPQNGPPGQQKGPTAAL